MGKLLMTAGAVLFVIGLLWHWRGTLGLGSLPGDFVFKRGNFTFYFPLLTSLILSLLLSLLLWFFRR
ncbi:MAG: hypothetical protein RIR26_729 [Pseudomonadota bacterium]